MKGFWKKIKDTSVSIVVKRIVSVFAEALLFVALVSWMAIGIALMCWEANWVVILSVFILGIVIATITEIKNNKTDL